MTRRDAASRTTRLLQRLTENPAARLVRLADGSFALSGPGAGRLLKVQPELVRALLSAGLIRDAEPRRYRATDAAAAFLMRAAEGENPFLAQHETLEAATVLVDGKRSTVTVSRDESPIGALSRPGQSGKRWLGPDAVAAAERLRRDFERGQLQPRITANWSASISTGRRADGKAAADLTETALAARIRFERAVEAAGPELAGVVVDVCCFLKGLETVERERSWPARSAKLVLRLGLEALARHYGIAEAANGRGSPGIRHWGAEGFRPVIS